MQKYFGPNKLKFYLTLLYEYEYEYNSNITLFSIDAYLIIALPALQS